MGCGVIKEGMASRRDTFSRHWKKEMGREKMPSPEKGGGKRRQGGSHSDLPRSQGPCWVLVGGPRP